MRPAPGGRRWPSSRSVDLAGWSVRVSALGGRWASSTSGDDDVHRVPRRQGDRGERDLQSILIAMRAKPAIRPARPAERDHPSVGAPLVGALPEGGHKGRPYGEVQNNHPQNNHPARVRRWTFPDGWRPPPPAISEIHAVPILSREEATAKKSTLERIDTAQCRCQPNISAALSYACRPIGAREGSQRIRPVRARAPPQRPAVASLLRQALMPVAGGS